MSARCCPGHGRRAVGIPQQVLGLGETNERSETGSKVDLPVQGLGFHLPGDVGGPGRRLDRGWYRRPTAAA